MALSEISNALVRLERAVARLETAAAARPPTNSPATNGGDEQVAAAAAAIAGRVEAALAKLDRLLDRETD